MPAFTSDIIGLAGLVAMVLGILLAVFQASTDFGTSPFVGFVRAAVAVLFSPVRRRPDRRLGPGVGDRLHR
jgi:hypothetical protein